MDLHAILRVAVTGKASDVHLKVGLPPVCRVNGRLVPFKDAPRLSSELMTSILKSMTTAQQFEYFANESELDFAYDGGEFGRYRVNVFRQRGHIGFVMRLISSDIPTITDLQLPKAVVDLANEHRGLILVTGITGSGKSTTLASMINYINISRSAHILTVEDPIEYLFTDRRSIINQREVGLDTRSFSTALRAALREDPDVILVGEMRDKETIETAFKAASTGHLVLSTLHTLDASETINRIISTFEPHEQAQIRLQLSAILKGVISQRLVPKKDGQGRVPAVELLKVTSRAKELIEDPDRTAELRELMQEGFVNYGMQTFDQSLMTLLKKGIISKDEALRQASNPDDFALRLSGIGGTSDSSWDNFENAEAGSENTPEEEMQVERF